MSKAAERQFNLYLLLVSTERPLTLEDISRQMAEYSDLEKNYDACRRRFERDKKVLRDSGYEIQITNSINGPAYKILRRRVFSLPTFTEQEISYLQRIMGWIKGGLINFSDFSLTYTDTASISRRDLLLSIYRAQSQKEILEFEYQKDPLSDILKRRALPVVLKFYDADWYVKGYDIEKQDFRVFRLSRFRSKIVPVGKATPEIDKLVSNQIGLGDQFFNFDAEPALVRIYLDSVCAEIAIRDLSPTESIVWQEDGSALVELKTENIQSVFLKVLQYLDGAVILQPDILRARVLEYLEAIG